MLSIRNKYDSYFILTFGELLLLNIGIICISVLNDGWNGEVVE